MNILRTTLGVIGVIYSLSSADFKGEMGNDLCKNILGEVVGGGIYDLIKGGKITSYNKIANLFASDINNPLNHDLQRAVRKAQLTATLLAVHASQIDLPKDVWLKKLSKILQAKINKLPDEKPNDVVEYEDILTIFDTRDQTKIQKDLVSKLKTDTIDELFKLGAEENLNDYSPDAHELLKSKIENGWDEIKDDNSLWARFKSLYSKEQKQNLINTEKQYDWFSLLCGFFTEEYKTNNRVTQAMQKFLLLEIRDKDGNSLQLSDQQIESINKVFLGHLEQFSDSFQNLRELLQRIDTKQDEILEFVKDNFRDLKETVERTAAKTQQVVVTEVSDAKSEIIQEVRTQFKTQNEYLTKSFASQSEEVQAKIEETIQNAAKFRRNILAKRNPTLLEKLVGRRFGFFDKLFGSLTPQEEFLVTLKQRYATRYLNKLDGRFEITLMVSDDLDSEIKTKYSGIYEGHGQLNEAFEYMRNSFQDANRLLIIGEPGVGKTVLLLKFANDLLDNTVEKLNIRPELRLDDIKDPIPVIFNLATWSESYTDFKDWLIEMLKTGEGLSKDFAAELLTQKKIFLLLDGLDELARNETDEEAARIREKCFESITGILKGGQKAIICCRFDEYTKIRKNIGQEDEEQRRKMPEVFVPNLTPEQIEDALKRASERGDDRESALNLLSLLKGANSEVLGDVLSVPFYFTTALEVFDNSTSIEKNLPADARELKDYLIWKLIGEKLGNDKKYNPRKTAKWLTWLAKLMKKKDLVVFELADLQPGDLKRPLFFKISYAFFILSLVCLAIFSIFIFMIIGGTVDFKSGLTPISNRVGSTFAYVILVTILFLISVFVSFIASPVAFIFSFRIQQIKTEESSKFSIKSLFKLQIVGRILLSIILYSILGCVLFMVVLFIVNDSVDYDSFSSLPFTIIRFVLIERIINKSRCLVKLSTLKGEYQRLTSGFIYLALRWILIIILVVLLNNFLSILGGSKSTIFEQGWVFIIFLLTFAFLMALINSAISQHLILRLFLRSSNSNPLRFATFLNYFSKMGLLQKDGGFWRFRHQELQDYFARLP